MSGTGIFLLFLDPKQKVIEGHSERLPSRGKDAVGGTLERPVFMILFVTYLPDICWHLFHFRFKLNLNRR